MMKEGQIELLLGVILLLIRVYITEQSAIQGMQIYPLHYAFANNTVTHGDNHCERYNRGVLPLIGINTTSTEYFYCNHPGLLTDSNLGPEQFSPSNTTEVYTWEPGVNRLLLTFTLPPKNITTIVLYYYRNSADVGLPKGRFCAVSVDFEIWNVTDSTRCQSQNEIRPGESACVEPCRENISITFNYYTEKLLMVIEDSKNYRFVLSEIEFYVVEKTTTTEHPTEVQPTTGRSQTGHGTTTDVDIAIGNTATDGSTLITTQDKGPTEEEFIIDGAAVGSVHAKRQIGIPALVAVVSVALLLVQIL